MDYGSFSNYADVESSVPQGSVLGPLIEILILIVNWQDSRLSITQLSIVGSGVDGRKVGHFLITIQKSFKLIIN